MTPYKHVFLGVPNNVIYYTSFDHCFWWAVMMNKNSCSQDFVVFNLNLLVYTRLVIVNINCSNKWNFAIYLNCPVIINLFLIFKCELTRNIWVLLSIFIIRIYYIFYKTLMLLWHIWNMLHDLISFEYIFSIWRAIG